MYCYGSWYTALSLPSQTYPGTHVHEWTAFHPCFQWYTREDSAHFFWIPGGNWRRKKRMAIYSSFDFREASKLHFEKTRPSSLAFLVYPPGLLGHRKACFCAGECFLFRSIYLWLDWEEFFWFLGVSVKNEPLAKLLNAELLPSSTRARDYPNRRFEHSESGWFSFKLHR